MSATTDEATPIAVKPRLSRDFGKLWTAAAFSNLADGVGRTAVPLIATTLTRDPLAIAAIGALAFLPWLVFGVPAGMIVDRFDRRWVMAMGRRQPHGTRVLIRSPCPHAQFRRTRHRDRGRRRRSRPRRATQ